MNPLKQLNRAVKRLFSLTHFRTGDIRFQCNICKSQSRVPSVRIGRELVSCRCGSTVRMRALVHVLSVRLFGSSMAIADMPHRPDLVGVDMSGSESFAKHIRERLGYTNTYLHQAPCLDIVAPPEEWLSCCDFVISSDVFEHVGTPVSRAFENTLRLLKPGGVFVLTVPYSLEDQTREHFPDLHLYQFEQRGGKRVLVNRTRQGVVQEFDQLVFHGGDGDTLEMRVFSEAGVLQELQSAGFTDVHIHNESVPEFGIHWPEPWSLPISARRPG